MVLNTPTYHRPPIQLHTPIYLKQHTGPLDVSQESGVSADQVEGTPGRAFLEKLGCRTPPQLHAGGVARQQQQLIRNWFSSTLYNEIVICSEPMLPLFRGCRRVWIQIEAFRL